MEGRVGCERRILLFIPHMLLLIVSVCDKGFGLRNNDESLSFAGTGPWTNGGASAVVHLPY